MGVTPVDFNFSEADFNHLIEKIRTTLEHLVSRTFPQMRPLLDDYFALLAEIIPPWLRDAAYKVIDWAIELLEDLTNLVIVILEGVLFPAYAFFRSLQWGHEVNFLHELEGDLKDRSDELGVTWQGEGARAFQLHATKQYDKVASMAELATAAEAQLMAGVGASLMFYAALATLVASTVTEAGAAVATTPLDGPAGPTAAGVSVGAGIGEVIAVVTMLGSAIGYMMTGWHELSTKAEAVSSAWPRTRAETYDDGSASDGDRTDWSTER